MAEYNHGTDKWSFKAEVPIANHKHCAIADEEGGNIYMIGGHVCWCCDQDTVYSYSVSNDEWHLHSELPYVIAETACGLVKNRESHRWLIVHKSGTQTVSRYDLETDSGWDTIGQITKRFSVMNMVSLTSYSAFMLSGNWPGFGPSVWNFAHLNTNDNYDFQIGFNFLAKEHLLGSWATASRERHYRAFQNCESSRIYAAVGWGGKAGKDLARNLWSVLLHKRDRTGLWVNPHSCHGVIPQLGPIRAGSGVTAIDYRLMVCGGIDEDDYDFSMASRCNWLDTNAVDPVWNLMEEMPIKRILFPFVTYGAVAYAIAGAEGDNEASATATDRVDHWNEKRTWWQMARYPEKVFNLCAVADEGSDRIFALGGENKNDLTAG